MANVRATWTAPASFGTQTHAGYTVELSTGATITVGAGILTALFTGVPGNQQVRARVSALPGGSPSAWSTYITLPADTTPTPVTPAPATPVVARGVSTPATWWIANGGAPRIDMRYDTGVTADGRFKVSWVGSMPDSRPGNSINGLPGRFEIDVPTHAQTRWQAYIQDMTSGATVAESGEQTGTAQDWTPASFSPVPGRTYRGWARVQAADGQWSPWSWRQRTAPSGRVVYLEDYTWDGRAADPTGVNFTGVGSNGFGWGPLGAAIEDLAPGDTLRSRKQGVTLEGVTSTGNQLSRSTGGFTQAMVGKKVVVYGAGTNQPLYWKTDGTTTTNSADPLVEKTRPEPLDRESVYNATTNSTDFLNRWGEPNYNAHRVVTLEMYLTITAVAADGKSATVNRAVLTNQTSCRIMVDYAEYFVDHFNLDNSRFLRGVAGAFLSGITLDFTGTVLVSKNPNKAGFRITRPNCDIINMHYTSRNVDRRGDGKNNDSGPIFVEQDEAIGNTFINCYISGAHDAGVLVYSGPNDIHVVDCEVDHSYADPFHVTGRAHHVYFIRPRSTCFADDGIANIGYRSDGTAQRPHHIVWEAGVYDNQMWGRGISYGGCYDALITDLSYKNWAGAGFLIGTDGDMSDTQNVQIRRFLLLGPDKHGQASDWSQIPFGTKTPPDQGSIMLINSGNPLPPEGILVEKGEIRDGRYIQVITYANAEGPCTFKDGTVTLRGITMTGAVNGGTNWADDGTYSSHIDLRGITVPAGSTPRGAPANANS